MAAGNSNLLANLIDRGKSGVYTPPPKSKFLSMQSAAKRRGVPIKFIVFYFFNVGGL
jgi:hypothetical protein